MNVYTRFLLLNTALAVIPGFVKYFFPNNKMADSAAFGAMSGVSVVDLLLTSGAKDLQAKSLFFRFSGIASVLTESLYDENASLAKTAEKSEHIFTLLVLKHALKYVTIDNTKPLFAQQSLMPFCIAGATIYLVQELYSGKASIGSSIYKVVQGCLNIAIYEVYDLPPTLFYPVSAVVEGIDNIISYKMPDVLASLPNFTNTTHADEL